jgi:hypothetical protein
MDRRKRFFANVFCVVSVQRFRPYGHGVHVDPFRCTRWCRRASILVEPATWMVHPWDISAQPNQRTEDLWPYVLAPVLMTPAPLVRIAAVVPAGGRSPRPSPVPSTSVSCHRWSAMSVISPCHLRDEVLTLICRLFEMAFRAAGRHTRSGDRW